MLCVAVSDTHMHPVETPPADLLIVAGDMTYRGTMKELNQFADWLKQQPQKHKVWIAGNHELGLEENPELGQRIAHDTGSIYLCNSAVEIEGIKIWGSPITPRFYDWAFMRRRGTDIRKVWDTIPDQLDVLITHGPPFGYLDLTDRNEHAGCEELAAALSRLAHPPRYHLFGHIHSGYGKANFVREDGKVVQLLNVSTCDEQYDCTNRAVLLEV